ncbi:MULTISPECIES: NUDIX domain-containing protein [unclassified Dietzia]|uniref:NUDIX domain-containing protein n=2 Tax=Dietzia TaxID=37914 RepID=UPI001317BBAD|nr:MULTISPECIES: NUDIX domain-containing protein [unclassified Dietzia]QGW25937.1 nudix superfamily hydrolase [Dietzia sp. DQ12-45-1b]
MATSEGDGNGWVVSAAGDRRWGRFGAAGLLLRAADPTDPDTPLVLLQHRAVWTASGDTWALPGGARDSSEDASQAALRETQEEAEIRPADVVVRAVRVTSRMPGTVWHRPGLDMRHVSEMMRRLRPDQKHSDDPAVRARTIPPLVQESTDAVEWTYTTVVADAPRALETVPNNESLELRWVPETRVAELPLMPAFAQAWANGLRSRPVELVVDVANVLGSRPDGWWRDRAGATARLLAELSTTMPRTVELPDGFGWVARAHAVIEGAARRAEHSGPFVVHRASGSGDDAIVDLATDLATDPAPGRHADLDTGAAAAPAGGGTGGAEPGGSRRVVVVTADRGLRARLPQGVVAVGPRVLLD